jgi:putative transcriptional regulator
VRKPAKGVRKSIGTQIVDGLNEAVAFERGELPATTRRVAVTARIADVAPAPLYTRDRIVRLRQRLRLSQPVFAMALNVSPETVRAWEQGKRVPDGAALRLLQLTEDHPGWVLESVQARPSGANDPEEA